MASNVKVYSAETVKGMEDIMTRAISRLDDEITITADNQTAHELKVIKELIRDARGMLNIVL